VSCAGAIQVAPSDPSVIYVGTFGLYRSDDGGMPWRKISPDLTLPKGQAPAAPAAAVAAVSRSKPEVEKMLESANRCFKE
jgi:hypothetical protein